MAILYRRKGGDALVNTQTASNQSGPQVAVLQDGGYVVVWTDASLIGGDSSASGIKAQRFDSSGAKVGGELLVNTTTAAAQQTATVATLPSGRFVVTWTDLSATGGDTSSRAIRGQLFEANGTPVGSEFLVNTVTAGAQDSSAVTELAGGGFVVAWVDPSGVGGDNNGSGIKAQLFDSSAAKVGGEFLVNTTITGNQTLPSLIGLPSGGFAAVWTSNSFATGTLVGTAWLQMFDSAGNKVGSEQALNDAPVPNVITANITALASGFVVTWAQQENYAPGPASYDIIGQIFNSAGAKVGGNFGAYIGPGSQNIPDAHALPGGGFLLTWQGPGEGFTNVNIFGQIFNASGGRMGDPFVISSVTDLNQLSPEVEVLPSGDIVVVWSDTSGTGGDSDAFAVKSQILTVSTAPPTDISINNMTISETAREGVPLAVLSTVGTLNSTHSYTILSDSSGGAFGIDGNKLVVIDNSLIDYETTAHQVQLLIRTTDQNGNSHEETFQLNIADTFEAGYAPEGEEFLVNTTVQNNQTEPVFTNLASGGYVALWIEWPLGGNGIVVSKAQIFDSSGARVGGELTIKGDAAAALPGGGFVTTWTQGVSQENLTDIKAQIYDSAGNAVGGEISVNAAVANYQQWPSVTTFASGGFVISWTDQPDPGTSRIYAQIFLPGGAKFGPEFLVAQYGGVSEVAALTSGNFVVTWSAGTAIMAQIYAPEGTRFGVEFPVSTLSGFLIEPHITALADGGFVVTYARNSSSGGFVGIDGLSAQIFDSNGVKVGSEILISEYGPTQVESTDVVALPWGGFVVGWTDQEASDSTGIRAQVFDSTGARIGSELAVNQITPGLQIQTAMTVLASGEIVIGWTSGDGNGFGVKARILSPLGPTEGDDIVVGTPAIDILDGLGGNDQIYGLEDADDLTGGSGNDLLDGGAGADSMTGGTGNDLYLVDNAGDTVVENVGEGIDEVRTGLAAYTLAANVENLAATSNVAHTFRDNAGDNVVTGGGGSDLLWFLAGGNDSGIGGAGHDVFLFGSTMDAFDSVDGGIGTDQIALQGGSAFTFGSGVVSIESLGLLSGADTRFGGPGGLLHSYGLTTVDSNVASGATLTVDGAKLLAGEDLTFDGSAETDGSFFIYGGRGVDTLTGGAKNDVFLFGPDGHFGASDVVDGGPGGTDQLALRGNYNLTFGAGQLVGIESIGILSAHDTRFGPLGSNYSYNLTTHDGNVASGVQMTVDGAKLRGTETLVFNGAAETNGSFRVFGGINNDNLTGSQNGDILQGHGGADRLTGGGGADSFRYALVSDSDGLKTDHILDFTPGTDKIDLSRVDANSLAAGDQAFSWIGSNAFSGVAGQLRAENSNGLGWFLLGDTNGDGLPEFVVQLTLQGPTPLGAGDFIL